MTNQLVSAKVRKSGAWVPAVGGSSAPWTRPSDWLTLPTIASGVQKFVGLFGVTNDDGNYVALKASGDYSVDWGDGSTENVTGGTSAEHQFAYADIDPATAVTNAGISYRQSIITVVPNGGDLTALNLQIAHSVFSGKTTPPNCLWLDHLISSSALAVLKHSLDGDLLVAFPYLEKFELRENAITDPSYLLYGGSNGSLALLGDVIIGDLTATSVHDCIYLACGIRGNLTIGNISSATIAAVIYCSGSLGGNLVVGNMNSATSIVSLSFFGGDIRGDVNIGNMNSVLDLSTDLLDLDGGIGGSVTVGDIAASTISYIININGSVFGRLTVGDMVNVTNLTNFIFIGNGAGVYGGIVIGSTPLLSVIDQMLQNDGALKTWAFDDASGFTSAATPFVGCSSLRSLLMPGLSQCDLDVSNCEMDRTALVALFASLGTAVAKTIAITGNYGSAALSAGDLLIATAKGWTVTQ